MESIDDEIPKIGLCGFQNIGNTCYMNSILQLLVHCKILILFLLKKSDSESDYQKYLEKASIQRIAEKERKKLNIDKNVQITIKKNDIDNFIKKAIVNKLSDIITILIQKGNSHITPVDLKQLIGEKIPSFKGFQQHDAHELLIQLLDNIIEETGIESEPIIIGPDVRVAAVEPPAM